MKEVGEAVQRESVCVCERECVCVCERERETGRERELPRLTTPSTGR